MERTKRRDRAERTTSSSGGDAGIVNPRARQRALCVAVGDDVASGRRLVELMELLRTARIAVAGELVQSRSKADPNTYLGSGKLAEVKEALSLTGANLIACDDELSPRQERNLESETGVPVVDRTTVILDIFADHSTSAEGNLQVELAQLEYNLSRMRGMWTHLERLGGGIGTRGPGETQIETDRRLARNRIALLKSKLESRHRQQRLKRKNRRRPDLTAVSLAGYTNAGKSTLLNAVTGADVGVGERLFHTLDPTTRSFDIDGRPYLLTDTVGFIRKLPHQLVAAFKATLEVTTDSDLILHVVDASAEEADRMDTTAAVEAVLEEIEAASVPRVTVLSKVDLLSADDRRRLAFRHPEGVQVSAATGEGIDELKQRIAMEAAKRWTRVRLTIPYTDGQAVHELHSVAGDLVRTDTPTGVRVAALLSQASRMRFARYEDRPASPAEAQE